MQIENRMWKSEKNWVLFSPHIQGYFCPRFRKVPVVPGAQVSHFRPMTPSLQVHCPESIVQVFFGSATRSIPSSTQSQAVCHWKNTILQETFSLPNFRGTVKQNGDFKVRSPISGVHKGTLGDISGVRANRLKCVWICWIENTLHLQPVNMFRSQYPSTHSSHRLPVTYGLKAQLHCPVSCQPKMNAPSDSPDRCKNNFSTRCSQSHFFFQMSLWILLIKTPFFLYKKGQLTRSQLRPTAMSTLQSHGWQPSTL